MVWGKVLYSLIVEFGMLFNIVKGGVGFVCYMLFGVLCNV